MRAALRRVQLDHERCLEARHSVLEREEQRLLALIAAAHPAPARAPALLSPTPRSAEPLPRAAAAAIVAKWLRSYEVHVLLRPTSAAGDVVAKPPPPIPDDTLVAGDADALRDVVDACAALRGGFASERAAMVARSAVVLQSLEASAAARRAAQRDVGDAQLTTRALKHARELSVVRAKVERRAAGPEARLAAAHNAALAAEAEAAHAEQRAREVEAQAACCAKRLEDVAMSHAAAKAKRAAELAALSASASNRDENAGGARVGANY